MGDRIGLVFVDKDGEESFVLQSHWAGRELMVAAQLWLRDSEDPIPELDCDMAVVRFVMYLGAHNLRFDSLTIQEKEDYDDCEDNGVFTVDLAEKIVR